MTAAANPRRYVRRLSGMERFALAINELYRYNIVAVIEGEGNLTRDELQSAVHAAAAANPGARVRLKYFLGFSRWIDSGIAPVVTEVDAPDWDGYSERGATFLESGFQPRQGGPVCDVLLVRGNPTRVIVRVLHAAMDGRGTLHFIKDIFKVLCGEAPIGSSSTLTHADITAKHLDKVKCTHPEMNCIPILPPSHREATNVRYVWRRLRLERNIGNLLPRMAVFLAQQARKGHEGDVGFTVPVDLRGLRENVHSTANLISMLYIKVDPEDTPITIMKQINQNIRDYADCITPTIMKLVPWLPISFIASNLRKNAEALLYRTTPALSSGGIVSMGMFKPKEFSCPHFTAHSCLGIPGSVGKMNVVFMNHDDHTEIIFSTPEAYNRDGQLDRLIADFRTAMEVSRESVPHQNSSA